MARYLIWNDIHAGSSIGLMEPIDFLGDVVTNLFQKNELYDLFLSIGDNLDFAGCKKKDVAHLAAVYEDINKIRSSKFKHIDGNHERMDTVNNYIFHEDVVFAHGDFEKWGYEKAMNYRTKSHGASAFKRSVIIPTIEFAEKFGVNRATKKFKEAASKLAKELGCHTYVCGHIHPKKRLDFIYDGIRIIVLPRGVNELFI